MHVSTSASQAALYKNPASSEALSPHVVFNGWIIYQAHYICVTLSQAIEGG